MPQNYLTNRYKKSFFSLHLQGPAYDDYALVISTELHPTYKSCYVKAVPRNKKDPRQTFLLIPETKDSDSFLIFNRCNGKVWTLVNAGEYDMIVEKDFDPKDETRSQLFDIQDAPNGKPGVIQIISSTGNAYGCGPRSDDILISRHDRDSDKRYRPICKKFLLSSSGNIVPLEISNEGNAESVMPSSGKLSLDEAALKKPLMTRVVRLPFFMVEDKAKTNIWKIQNSPWYYLRREVRLVSDLSWFINNDSSVKQVRTYETKSGSKQSTMHSFSAGVGISATGGANFFGNKIEVTVSASLGYAVDIFSSTSAEVKDTLKIVAPPYTKLTMFQAQSTLTLLRADGTEVASLAMGDKGLYYKAVSLKDQTERRFILNPDEAEARVVTDDNEIGDTSPIATRVSSDPLEA